MFINLANKTPVAVAIPNEKAPNANILIELEVKKPIFTPSTILTACVDAPTQSPKTIVIISIKEFEAVLAKRSVTPLSFSRFPKKSIPNNDDAPGAMRIVTSAPTMGNNIFSRLVTSRGVFMWIRRSFFVVSNFIIGG